MKVKDADIHHHLRARMLQRGISKEEKMVLLTAKARYGKNFKKGGN